VSDPALFFKTVFQGCASQASSLAGVELSSGEVSVQTTSELPDRSLAVLPVILESAGESPVALVLCSPLEEIVAIARRGSETDDPGSKELSEEDVAAIGEILNPMAGAIDQALREHLSPDLSGKPETWWRTDDAGDRVLPEGECVVGEAALSGEDGTSVSFLLRVPQGFLEASGSGAKKRGGLGRVVVSGIDDETRKLVESLVAGVKGEVESVDPEDSDFLRRCACVDSIVLGGESCTQRCRELRVADATWQIPTVLALEEPTRARVLEALDAGASRVLRVPCDEAELRKALKSVED
jgi:CheY-like chemotaxis protein